MKLIFCPECCDVRALRTIEVRISCACGKSHGIVANDRVTATIGGIAIPLGFHNTKFFDALKRRPRGGMGSEFLAFVIPHDVPSVKQES
jgi:hypothetical protein